jgi:hypothetical protein
VPLVMALEMPRVRILIADEEERTRLRYEVISHYRSSGRRQAYRVRSASGPSFWPELVHDGQLLLINQGHRNREGEQEGFTLCVKCHKWLVGRDAAIVHVGTPQERGQCSRNSVRRPGARAMAHPIPPQRPGVSQ